VYELGRKPGTNLFRRLEDHPDDETIPGVLMVRMEGFLNFSSQPNSNAWMRKLIMQRELKAIIVDMSSIVDIEYTALLNVIEFEEQVREAGVQVYLVNLNPEPYRIVMKSDLGQRLGQDFMFFTMEQALDAYHKRTHANEN
jgi:anti-anti-sigma factor